MSFHALESEQRQPIVQSGLRLAAPICQHAYYERLIEDHRFARAQCLRCPHSWVEVDISMDREGLMASGDQRPFPKLIPNRFEGDAIDFVPNVRDLP